MSAIQSNLAAFLLPAYSKTSSQHGPSCNCSSCSSKTSASGATLAGGSATTAAQSGNSGDSSSQSANAAAPTDAAGRPLSKSQQAEVAEMKKTDAAVRRHEQAHLSAAGAYARSGIVLNFKTGPDGKQYAVGGHVDIDTSKVAGNPKATIAKMQVVERAALAPSDPSGQDRNVAAQAAQTASQAQAQLDQSKQGTSGAPATAASDATGSQSATASPAGAGATATGTVGSTNAAGTAAKRAIATKFSQAAPISAASSGGGGSSSGQLLDVTA